jgi:integrase
MLQREINKFEKILNGLRPQKDVFEHNLDNGLSVRVTKTGKKVFQGRYMVHGKRKRFDHGYYPNLSVEEAFSKHRSIQNSVDDGENPFLAVTQGRVKIQTMGDLFNQWHKRVGLKRKRPDSPLQIITADIIPTIGDIPLAKIRKSHFLDLIYSIQDRGAETQAERTRVLCKQVLKWGTQNDYLDKNPIADINAKAIGYKSKSRERFLTDAEIGIVWNGLDLSDMTTPTINAIKVMILTGLRRSEPYLAKWTDIDFENQSWKIPAANNKSDRANEVMISELLKSVLLDQKKFCDLLGGSVWVFPAFNDQRIHIDPKSVTRAVKRHCDRAHWKNQDDEAIPAWTPHALRHTFETKLTEIGIDYVVMKRLLNHEIGNMSGVYNHAELRDRKLAAMEKWASKIEALVNNHE